MRISDWSSDVCSSDLARLIWASPAFVVLRSGYSTSPRNRHAVSVFDQARMSLGFDQFGRRHLCAHLRHSALQIRADGRLGLGDRKGVVTGKRVSEGVDLGSRCNFQKTKNTTTK